MWMVRQDLRNTSVEWIVVDDCDPPTHVRFGQTVIRPMPRWEPGGKQTFTRNMLAGLAAATGEKILFIEDDEFYARAYLQNMNTLLDSSQLVGQAPARYYHVGIRRFRVLPNHTHASLCQTGIRAELKTRLRGLLEASPTPFIDIPLWNPLTAGTLVRGADDVVSIKGLPGRPGIGIGHRPGRGRPASWTPDSNLEQLKRWCGDDADLYACYADFDVVRNT